MCGEVNFSSVDFDEFDGYIRSFISQPTLPIGNFHEAIPYAAGDSARLNRTVSFGKNESETTQRIQKVSSNNGIAPKGRVSGEAGVVYEWGGKDGGGVSGYVSGSAKDDNGNKAEVEVEVNNDGSGSVSVSVSHDEETNN